MDPRLKYPQPPFPTSSSDDADDASPIEPDHGEAVYTGTMKLAGKRAFISGGDSGIGKAIAIAYAREGADVCIGYHSSKEDAEATVDLVTQAGVRGHCLQFDQAEPSDCKRAIAEVAQQFGGLDILVNNAAMQATHDSIQGFEADEIEKIFHTNILGLIALSKEALKIIEAGGSIINTTSIQAYSPSLQLAPYSATKAAIANFTIALAKEAIESGIRVNGVAPGPVWTPLIPETMSDEDVREFGKGTLFGRPAQPVELAPLYVFLASQEASYITAEIFGATGGMKQL